MPLVAAGAGIEGPRVEVDDPLVALGAIARAHVDRVFTEHGRRPVLTIGGSAGKTTAKTLAAAACGALFGDTLVTAGNINNRLGVPMTLLTLEPSHHAVVLECATSFRGEIVALAAIARPDVALLTTVGIEHSERLGTLEEIADEEFGMLHAARRAAVTHGDEPLLVERLTRTHAPIKLTFGTRADCDVRLVERSVGESSKTRLLFQLGDAMLGVEVLTPLLGPAAAMNVAAALGSVLAMRESPLSADELAGVAAALGEVEAVHGRMCPREVAGIQVLDDSYNSNPKSLAAAFATVAEMSAAAPAKRVVLALGDMLELGPMAPAEHDAMVRAADRLGAVRLILVGKESAAAAARQPPRTPSSTYPDSSIAAAEIRDLVKPGDLLLVKASRGTRMERLIEALARTTN